MCRQIPDAQAQIPVLLVRGTSGITKCWRWCVTIRLGSRFAIRILRIANLHAPCLDLPNAVPSCPRLVCRLQPKSNRCPAARIGPNNWLTFAQCSCLANPQCLATSHLGAVAASTQTDLAHPSSLANWHRRQSRRCRQNVPYRDRFVHWWLRPPTVSTRPCLALAK